VLVRTRVVGLNTAMMAAKRGQRSFHKRVRETDQTERSDSEEGSPADGRGEMESSEHSKGCMLAKQRRLSNKHQCVLPYFLELFFRNCKPP